MVRLQIVVYPSCNIRPCRGDVLGGAFIFYKNNVVPTFRLKVGKKEQIKNKSRLPTNLWLSVFVFYDLLRLSGFSM